MSLASDMAERIAQEACERASRAFVCAVNFCADEGYPLLELQQIAIVSGLLSCFDGLTRVAEAHLSFDPAGLLGMPEEDE